MTTAYGSPHLRGTALRTRATPRRLHIVHGHRRLHLWHPRLVLAGLIGGAMAGALLAVAYGLLVVEQRQPLEVLQSYGIGAGLGAGAGLVLGLLLSAGWGVLARYVLPQHVAARPLWVRHRR